MNPAAFGEYPERERERTNPRGDTKNNTTNLERNPGENFTYYVEHKRLRILNLCGAIAAMSLGARDISLKACVASDVLRANPLIIGDVWGFGPMTSDALHAI